MQILAGDTSSVDRVSASWLSTLASGTFHLGSFFPSSADSRRANFQLLTKECALNTGKLPLGGLPRNSVVPDMPSAVNHGCKSTNEIKQIKRL